MMKVVAAEPLAHGFLSSPQLSNDKLRTRFGKDPSVPFL